MSEVGFGYDPKKIRQLVVEIRLRLALMPAEINGHGRPVLTVKADSEAVVLALEQQLTAEEMRKIQWVIRG
jgi:hypothetical protein